MLLDLVCIGNDLEAAPCWPGFSTPLSTLGKQAGEGAGGVCCNTQAGFCLAELALLVYCWGEKEQKTQPPCGTDSGSVTRTQSWGERFHRQTGEAASMPGTEPRWPPGTTRTITLSSISCWKRSQLGALRGHVLRPSPYYEAATHCQTDYREEKCSRRPKSKFQRQVSGVGVVLTRGTAESPRVGS